MRTIIFVDTISEAWRAYQAEPVPHLAALQPDANRSLQPQAPHPIEPNPSPLPAAEIAPRLPRALGRSGLRRP